MSRDTAVRPPTEGSQTDGGAAASVRRGTLSRAMSRRAVLGAGAVGVAGAATAAAFDPLAAYAAPSRHPRALKQYFNILATGEALFTTFYALAALHHHRLGLRGPELNGVRAIAAEEAIHLRFALAHGGTPATESFSFPHGKATFRDRDLFIATQQLAEDLTNGALVAWIKDMATMGHIRLAELGGQLQQVEGGHRVFGRFLQGAEPYPNWGFGPVVLDSFLQVPEAVTAAGFLSPRPGNDFPFRPVAPRFPGVVNTTPGPT